MLPAKYNCTIFELSLEDRLHLGNKNKIAIYFVFRSICTIFAGSFII